MAEVSLAPKSREPDWHSAISIPEAPWAKSFEAMPDQATAVVKDGFAALVCATRDANLKSICLDDLPEGRARAHLRGLIDLGDHLDALPRDLAIARHVIENGAILENMPVCKAPLGFDCALENAIHDRLKKDFGEVEGLPAMPAQCESDRLLGHVQRNLLGDALPAAVDESLRVFGIRDASSQAEMAAAMARGYLEKGADLSDIAIAVPDNGVTFELVAAAFEKAAIPLNCRPENGARDTGREFLRLLLQILRPSPPPMALAAFCLSELMPWDASEGREMARRIMKYGSLNDLPEWLKDAAGRKPESNGAVMGIASSLFGRIPGLKPLFPKIAARCSKNPEASADWNELLKSVSPRPNENVPGMMHADAVGLWFSKNEPLKPVRHLIVAGFSGNAYPRTPGLNPLFLESELNQISQRLGLKMPARRDFLQRELERFQRQIGAASGTLDLLVPRRELNGDFMHPSPALALVLRCAGRLQAPDEFICEITRDNIDRWPCAREKKRRARQVAPRLPKAGVIKTGRNLLHLRMDADNRTRPQSPSRLEHMMLSPVVWTMRESNAEPREWHPRGLDILTQGSLFHAFLENMFPARQPVPDEDRIKAEFQNAFNAALRTEAPFLSDPLWNVERESLESEARQIALDWRLRLRELNATVIATEKRLKGTVFGIGLSGIADSILALPDGIRLVVDFKTASSSNRKARMEAGWDLQVALYREMIENPKDSESVSSASGGNVGIAYHLLRDGITLASGPGSERPALDKVPGDISHEAMKELRKTIGELAKGKIRLNGKSDIKRYKDAKIEPHELNRDRLALAFMIDDAARRE